MKCEMSRKEELQELKTKARAVQVRLDLLEMQIGKVGQGVPETFQ